MLAAVMTITVGELWHHPVKSMRGERVEEVVLGPGGLIGDRAYGFVDLETERLISAKHPKRYAALLECHAAFVEPPRVDAPTPPVRVTFPDGTSTEDEQEITRGVAALLGREVKLVTSLPPGVLYEEVWPELEGFGPDEFYGMLLITPADQDDAGERIVGIPTGVAAPGTLVDFGAMHVVAASTLTALAAAHPDGDWDVRRFRPNVVFQDEGTGEPGVYAEDEWVGSDLQIGESARVHIVAPTPRCIMPTLAQGELARDHDILRTVARVNRRSLGELGRFACAGAYAEVVAPGVVRTGDPVVVVPSAATGSPLVDAVQMLGAALQGVAAGD
jgi:hypothetical protein